MDPCDSIKTIRENDPLRMLLAAVLIQWEKALGTDSSFTVQQIIDKATTLAAGQLAIAGKMAIPADPDFYHALIPVAASEKGTGLSNQRLGQWLSRNNGKIVGKFKLARGGVKTGYPLWQVLEV
jgi:hypothetical protein